MVELLVPNQTTGVRFPSPAPLPLSKDLNPCFERQRQYEKTVTASGHIFMAVYVQWLGYCQLSLEKGRQASLSQIAHVFRKDVLPALRELKFHEIARTHLLDNTNQIARRGSFLIAEKLQTWFD